ncbi:hypothetical protein [Amycolatopsis sp. WGS_07]|uniref:hypothetical protein n=1 Tax=Amycolatopsis sp. WGS_07 TaxID=3076764 RepID=UPI003872CE7B
MFGTRAMTVARFAVCCNALGLPLALLSDRVYNETNSEGLVVVDLARVALSGHPLARRAEIRTRELSLGSMGRLLVTQSVPDRLTEIYEWDKAQPFDAPKAA